MKFDGAVITQHRITFAIAVVKSYALHRSDRESIRKGYSSIFGNIPIILAAQDSSGNITYHGRKDIVKHLANIDPLQIPWQTYTVN